MDSSAKTDHACNVRCARFKFMRDHIVGCFFKSDRVDHVTATIGRGHFVKEFSLTVKDADACGTEHFMSGEGVKVTVQILNVNFGMCHRLSAVDQDYCILFMSGFNYFFDGIDCS